MLEKQSILIVDDEELNRDLLSRIFRDEYSIITAENGKEAIEIITKLYNELAAIILDIEMPVLNGYQVLQMISTTMYSKRVPVVLITAQDDEEVQINCYKLGAMAVISKPFSAKLVRERVDDIVDMFQSVNKMEAAVRRQAEELEEQRKKLSLFNENLIEAVSNIVEFRDLESGKHIKRVKGLTRIMAENYRLLHLDEDISNAWIENVVSAAALHDIGKITIPDSILLKPGKLTEEEREVMKTHTIKGCEVIEFLGDVQDFEQYQEAYNICRHHHERADGNGYPDGLKGDEIPLSAALVSIVDVFDALISKRVYKNAFSMDVAIEMIVNGECGKFSDKILDCFEFSMFDIKELVTSMGIN